MAAYQPWTLDEIDDAHRLDYEAFKALHPDRTFDAWRIKRGRTPTPIRPRDFTSDKVVGEFNWRDANRVLADMQDLKRRASYSQDEATIAFDTDQPICVVTLSDAHIGAWSSDHGLFETITDEILGTPNLYVALLGDIEHMAIKLRGVLEVSDNALPPDLQHRYVESWLDEIAPRILLSTWDNHAVEREEVASGYSHYADMMKRRVVWHSGIGHPNIRVGQQEYRLAVAHHFQGRSIYNPVHGAQRYLTLQGHDREIAMCGDSHVPGLLQFVHGNTTKLAINSGSSQTNSGYAKRFFSLVTHPIFPCVEFYPDQHRFVGYWSVSDWVRGRPTSVVENTDVRAV